MAIWQYNFNIIPKETEELLISWNDKNGPDTFFCWQKAKLNINFFDEIGNILPKTSSWSKKIIQYGDLNSHCFEILHTENIIDSVSFRIDFTDKNYTEVLKQIIFFCNKKRLLILDVYFNIIPNYNIEKLSKLIETFSLDRNDKV